MADWDEKNADTSIAFFAKGMRMLWDLVGLGDEKKNLAYVFVLSIILQILGLSFPYLFKIVFDELSTIFAKGEVNSYLIWIVATMSFLRILALGLNRFVKEPILVKSLIRLENFWPVAAQEKLLSLSLGYHEKENTGKKIAKIEKGCNRLLQVLMDLFWQFIPQVLYMAINIIVIIVMDWKLGVIFLIPFIPAILINLKCYKLFAHKWDKWDSYKEKSLGLLIPSVINISTVQGFVQEEREKNNFSVIREKMEKLDVEVSMQVQKYFFAVGLILNLFFIITIVAGIYFVYSGISTVGTVVYIFATGSVTIECVQQLTHVYTQIMKNIVSAIRMKELFDEKPDIINSKNVIVPEKYNGKFVFDNIRFSYGGKDRIVLRDFSLNIEPKQMIALVSRTGEGKTTIIKLLCRMHDISKGKVLLDGTNIKDIDLFWYRRLFAIVQQDVDIFDASILDNVRYPYPDTSEKQVIESINAAHLKVVIKDGGRFPDGINTQVGERGVRLSGGERQRIGIARAYLALLNGAKVLVLDEATSSLDSEAEKAIQEMIDKLRKRMSISIIAIAHRLSTIRKSDMIYVIGDGNIVEEGNHDRLMSKNGLYAKLVELQKFGALRR